MATKGDNSTVILDSTDENIENLIMLNDSLIKKEDDLYNYKSN